MEQTIKSLIEDEFKKRDEYHGPFRPEDIDSKYDNFLEWLFKEWKHRTDFGWNSTIKK